MGELVERSFPPPEAPGSKSVIVNFKEKRQRIALFLSRVITLLTPKYSILIRWVKSHDDLIVTEKSIDEIDSWI